MSVGIHDHGKEYLQRVGFNDLSPVSTISVGLYNDSTDSLTESNDLSDITTEPSGASYARQTASLSGDVSFSQDGNNDIVVDVADQTFDTSDSSQSVDSFFVVINFQASVVTSDGSATDHIFFTGNLGDTLNLSSWSEVTARDIQEILQRP